jgi:hypothetical protein
MFPLSNSRRLACTLSHSHPTKERASRISERHVVANIFTNKERGSDRIVQRPNQRGFKKRYLSPNSGFTNFLSSYQPRKREAKN